MYYTLLWRFQKECDAIQQTSIGVNFAKVVSFKGKNTRLCYETIYVAT